MSFKSDIRQKVEYQCNSCGKQRILFIAPALQSDKVTSHGYIEYCDVHICKKEQLNAVKLFVDVNYDVRSQVTIKAQKDEEKADITEISGLNIPMPKKTEFRSQVIKPTKDFGGYDVKLIKIKDKLRECNYILEGETTEIVVKTVSPLNFIEIEIHLSNESNYQYTDEWLIGLANLFESLVYLDEELLSYLGTYLDHMIVNPPKQKELLELNLLMHSSIAIPHSTLEHIKIFEEHKDEIFPELDILSFRMYKMILESCLNNEDSTIIDIYKTIQKKMIQIQAFPYFLTIISTLTSFGFLNIEKLEFYTVG